MKPSALVFGLGALGFVALVACGQAPATTQESGPALSNGFGTGKKAKTPTGPCVKDASFYDVPGDGCDNDDDGTVDNPKTCDSDTGDSATDFAHAMGICNDASRDGFGLVKATFSRGFDDPSEPEAEQHGTLSKFGNVLKPREGKKLGVLSTGYAQEFNGDSVTPFFKGKHWLHDVTTQTALPAGFPKATGDCPQDPGVSDVIILNLTLKAPKNAGGVKLDFNFHSSEWPEWICTKYNDGFIAYITSKAKTDNISFDAKGSPVSVNNGFFDRCTPSTMMGCKGDTQQTSVCASGDSELAGTGFGLRADACGSGKSATQGGATGWLSSSSPIDPEETFTLQLAIWDTGDGDLDSSVLLDNFRWVGGKVTETTTERADEVK